MMALFGLSGNGRKKTDKSKDEKLEAEFSELVGPGSQRIVDRAKSDAEATISDAAMADIRDMALIQEGRCPECGVRTDRLVFGMVCSSCGWYKRDVPEGGQCLVHLENGETVECDKVFNMVDGQLLCVRANVAVCQLAGASIRRIDYHFSQGSLDLARERFRKEQAGVCAWCEQGLAEAVEPEAPFVEFVAFGASQSRHAFCSRKCLAAFRKQYPVRIHRNCYETDCNTCHQCIKRYDTRGILPVEID